MPTTLALSTIPQADPGAFFRAHRAEILAATGRVVDSGWYILGNEVKAFEAAFAAACGVDFGVGVANGTDAVALALRAVGVAPGDTVATVSHTAVATVAAIEMVGALPLLLDIAPDTYLLSAATLEEALSSHPGVKAVVVVHLYGQAADVPALAAVAARHGAVVVEDCSQAHGATWNGAPVGSLGAAGTFSFYPTKNLGALGDGGMVVTGDARVAARLRMLREYGWKARYVSEIAGVNSRLDELQAALLGVRLPYLAAANQRRRAIAAAYDRAFAPVGLTLPVARPPAHHVYHQYVVRHPDRDGLRTRLAEAGVGTNIHYPVPIHRQTAYQGRVALGPAGLPHTETAAREILSLPMYGELGDAAVARVIDVVVRLA